jgi:hypothetical protein
LKYEYTRSQDILVDFKVYIAGQYAPAQEVLASQGVFSFSEASISLFPHKSIIDFGENDRVPVQIFFLDYFYDKKNPEYKLLFEGEVVGTSDSRNAMSASMNITCVSQFEILSQMFMHMYTDLESMVVNKFNKVTTESSELGLSSLVGDGLLKNFSDAPLSDGMDFSYLFTKDYLKAASPTTNDPSNSFMRRPFTFLRNIFVSIINGSSLSKDTAQDIQLFFKNYVSKRRIIQSCFASPYLEKYSAETKNLILAAIDSKRTSDAIMTGLSFMAKEVGTDTTVSYWELITRLFAILMYEVLNPLCPPQLSADIFGVPASGTAAYTGVLGLLTKPEILGGIPLISNTIFPSMINNNGGENRHRQSPTRFYLGNPAALQKLGSTGIQNDAVSAIVVNQNSAIWPPQLQKINDEGKEEASSAMLWDSKGGMNEFFKGPVVMSTEVAPSWVNYINSQYTQTDDKAGGNSDTQTQEAEGVGHKDDMKKVLYLYAQNRYERHRAASRARTIELKFHPYLVMGYPSAVIDSIETGAYYIGVPLRATHRLSSNGASTTVTFDSLYSFPKALGSTLDEAKRDLIVNNPGLLTPEEVNIVNQAEIGPLNPSLEVAKIFNINANASKYYRDVFFQKDTLGKANFTFVPNHYFHLNGDFTIKSARYDLKTPQVGYTPMIEKAMMDYGEALEFVARPIVTLAQYLNSKGTAFYMNKEGNADSISRVADLSETGADTLIVAGGGKDISSAVVFSEGASTSDLSKRVKLRTSSSKDALEKIPVFYYQILGYTYMGQRLNNKAIFSGNKPTDVGDFPDFIKDWASLIKAYRTDILTWNKDHRIG